MASPTRVKSQPTPTAPGPYSFQRSSSTWAMWRADEHGAARAQRGRYGMGLPAQPAGHQGRLPDRGLDRHLRRADLVHARRSVAARRASRLEHLLGGFLVIGGILVARSRPSA